MPSRTRTTLALGACGVFLAAFFTAQTAQATEQPEPDSPTFNVVLTSPVTTARITVTTDSTSPEGKFCASVWSQTANPAFLGRACSASRTFRVPLKLDARTFPLGRSPVAIVDDAAGPPRVTPDTAYIVARLQSVFGLGVWQDKGQGNLYVRAHVYVRDPLTGKLRPSNKAPVAVQELTRRGWRTRGTAYSVNGVVRETVHLGPGIRYVRVYRVQTGTATAVDGTKRKFNLLTEPVGVI